MLLRIADLDGEPLEVPLIAVDRAEIGALIALKLQAGLSMKDIGAIEIDPEDPDPTVLAVILFLSLSAAGKPRTWQQVLKVPVMGLSFVREPGDGAEEEDDAADPSVAPPASAPDGAAGAAEPDNASPSTT